MLKEELINLALIEVEDSSNDWLSYETVRDNLISKGFIVNEMKFADYYSYMVFSKDKSIKIININEELDNKNKYENLLQQYCTYVLSDEKGNGFVSVYNKKGKRDIKNLAKLLYREIREVSADKVFGKIDYKIKEKVK